MTGLPEEMCLFRKSQYQTRKYAQPHQATNLWGLLTSVCQISTQIEFYRPSLAWIRRHTVKENNRHVSDANC